MKLPMRPQLPLRIRWVSRAAPIGALCLGLSAAPPLGAISNDRVFAFAQANYPDLFAGTVEAGRLEPYEFRFYAASRNYLGVDRDGTIAMLGPATGNAVLGIGPKLAFEAPILAWEASTLPPGACRVDATSSFGTASTAYRLCYRRLPPGLACSAAGMDRHVADHLGLGSGYTYRIDATSTVAECPTGSSAVDLGGHFSGAAYKVTPTLLNSSNEITDMAWDGSRFLLTTSRFVAHSGNGVNWAQAQVPSSGVGELMSIAVGPARRVAVGRASGGVSTLLASGDGLSWQRVTPPAGSTGALLRVIWAENQFVAVGAAQTLLTSPDGLTWTRRNAPPGSNGTGQINDLAWNGREFLAVGTDLGGFVHRSTDGASWTTERLPTGVLPNAVVWDGTRFHLSQTVGSTHQIVRSTDGRTWSGQQLATLFPVKRLQVIGPRLLGVGDGGVFSSDNGGASWVEIRHGALRGLSMTNGRGVGCSDARCLVAGSFGTVYSTF